MAAEPFTPGAVRHCSLRGQRAAEEAAFLLQRARVTAGNAGGHADDQTNDRADNHTLSMHLST